MLTHGELKPHLLHEDRWVRQAVIDYFGDSRSRDPEVAKLVLASHDRYYRKGEFPLLGRLADLVLDDEAAYRILDLLEADPSHITGIHLNWSIAAFPRALIRTELERIERNPRVNEETRAQMALRRELAAQSDQELWRRFLDFSGRERMRRTPVRQDGGLADALIEQLAERESPGEEAVCEMLASRTYSGTFFDGLVVKLAGGMGSKRAVPHIVRRISEDEENDNRPPYVHRALARIGDPAAVAEIRSRWGDYSRDSRMTAACILGTLKTVESEQALLQFMKREHDRDVRYYLAEALCDLFSREGIFSVLQVIREGCSYDPLDNKLLPVLDVLGIDHLPQAREWRKARDEHHALHPLRDEPPGPEAELLHKKIMECQLMIDMAQGGVQMCYEELGKRLAEGDEE